MSNFLKKKSLLVLLNQIFLIIFFLSVLSSCHSAVKETHHAPLQVVQTEAPAGGINYRYCRDCLEFTRLDWQQKEKNGDEKPL